MVLGSFSSGRLMATGGGTYHNPALRVQYVIAGNYPRPVQDDEVSVGNTFGLLLIKRGLCTEHSHTMLYD